LAFSCVKAESDIDKYIDFNIPSQNADVALKQFAQQAEKQFLFPYEAVKNHVTSSVKGRYTAEKAISILLDGTGMKAVFTEQGDLTIQIEKQDRGDETMQARRDIFSTITALLFSTLVVEGVQAQQAGNPALEEIVVTAQRRAQSLQEVPISVLAITGEDIERQGFKDLRDLSEFAPTLRVDDTSAIDPTISIRGFGTEGISAVLESAVPIFVDNIHYSKLSMVKIGFLDVEAMEILKGPQPLYFGQNATAGAISIRSRRPTPEWEGNFSLEYGDRADHTATIAAGGPITDTLGVRAALTYSNDPGPITHLVTQQKIGRWENIAGRISLQWQPTDKLSIYGKVEMSDLDRDVEARAICWRGGDTTTASPGNYAPG
jgi:outer membrane receptor protein involved in Fe transport